MNNRLALLVALFVASGCGSRSMVTGTITAKHYSPAWVQTTYVSNGKTMTPIIINHPESCSIQAEYSGKLYWNKVPCGSRYFEYSVGDTCQISVPEKDAMASGGKE